MHTEYRILNVVVSLDSNNKPSVLSDIAIFNVDKKEKKNDFVGIIKQVSSRYPYLHEYSKNNIDVVVLDDLGFNGDLKILLKKHRHMVMTSTDYQYKNYFYVICKLDSDAYLVYSLKNNLEILSFADLMMLDEVGRLFNANLSVTTSRGKEVYKVICGTNSDSMKKRTENLELRNYNAGDVLGDGKGKFAIDIVNLKNNPNISELLVSDGHIESFLLNSYDEDYSFVLPSSIKELLTTGRPYKISGVFKTLDISSISILNKNSLQLKADCKELIISEDLAKSSNLDFLVYSLRQYTGDRDYDIENLIIKDVTSDFILDLVIRLLAELRFNTDFDDCSFDTFPIKHIEFEGKYLANITSAFGVRGEDGYKVWLNKGLTRFSVQLLENYTKAVGYYKKAVSKSGKELKDLSVQTLELLSEYEDSLLNALKFFNFVSALFLGVEKVDMTVYNTAVGLIHKNNEERTGNINNRKDEFIDNILKNI